MRLTDPLLYHCPFVMMTEPGGAYFDEAEAAQLRDYLLKGGFLWADDFWGEYAFGVLGGRDRQGAAARAISDRRPAARPRAVSHALRHPPHSADSVDRLLGRTGRHDVGARPRQRRAARARHPGRATAASWC